LDGTKFRAQLIKFLSREFPPKVIAKDVLRAVENIPYRRSVYRKKKKKIIERIKLEGALKINKISAVYLTPLRLQTLEKIIEILKVNKDLKNLRLSYIRFENRHSKPSVKKDKETKAYVLTLSDFATQNNIYSALKKIPLK